MRDGDMIPIRFPTPTSTYYIVGDVEYELQLRELEAKKQAEAEAEAEKK